MVCLYCFSLHITNDNDINNVRHNTIIILCICYLIAFVGELYEEHLMKDYVNSLFTTNSLCDVVNVSLFLFVYLSVYGFCLYGIFLFVLFCMFVAKSCNLCVHQFACYLNSTYTPVFGSNLFG